MDMIRKDFFLTDKQAKFLSEIEGNASEHVRRAIDKYINDIKKLDTSISPTKGGEYGR